MTKKILLLCTLFFAISSAKAQFQQCANLAIESTDNSCAIPTTTLEAHFLNTGYHTTDDYVVGGEVLCLPELDGTSPSQIVGDDDWSFVVTIGFNFCFYGNMYDQFIISDNGKISFDLEMANQEDPNWNLGSGIGLPSPNWQPNAIFAPHFDTDVRSLPPGNLPGQRGAAIGFKMVNQEDIGNRARIITFDAPQFGCNNQFLRSTIVLYEGSNVIDIEIREKDFCNWNGGRAMVGIQNKSATRGVAPAGRNNGTWDINDPDGELWRFVPDGLELDYSFEWQVDYGDGEGYVTIDFPNDPEPPTLIEVNPENDATYRAQLTYATECAFEDNIVTLQSEVIVTPPSTPNTSTPNDLNECETVFGTGIADFDLDLEAEILGTMPGGYPAADWSNFNITYHATYASAASLSTDASFDPIDISSSYTAADGTIIYIRVEEDGQPECDDFSKFFTLNVIPKDNTNFTYPDSGGTDPLAYCVSIGNLTPITIDTVAGGTYSVSNGGVWANPLAADATKSNDGILDATASDDGDDDTGEFTITYSTPSTNTCPNSSDVIITIGDASFTYIEEICLNESTNPVASDYFAGGTFTIKDSGGTTIATNANGELDLSTITAGVYDITYTVSGCDETNQITVKLQDDVSFSYPDSGNTDPLEYCAPYTTLTPQDFGTDFGGGKYSITNGGVWVSPLATDATKSDDGIFDADASDMGTDSTGIFEITYTTPSTNLCPSSYSLIVTLADTSFTYLEEICLNETTNPIASDFITGGVFTIKDSGGTTVVTNATGELDLTTIIAGVYDVTYKILECEVTKQITVYSVDDASSFVYPNSGNTDADTFCNDGTDPIPNRNDGTFTINNGGVIDANSGVIDLDGATPTLGTDGTGEFKVTFTTDGDCPDTKDFVIFIVVSEDATFDYPTDLCINADNPIPTNLVSGGDFAVVGGLASINASGVLDLDTTTAGVTYEITYSFNAGVADNCYTTSSQFITIHEIPTATIPTTLITECNRGDNTAEFDLSVLDNEIIAGQTNVEISYHESEDDAKNDTGELSATAAIVSENVWARVESPNGCFSVVEVPLLIDDCFLSLPEGFSPNSDVTDNQTFDVGGMKLLYPNFTMVIYDRYGKVVYEGGADKDNWNGQLDNTKDVLPAGTYFYVLELNDDIQNLVYRGWVYLHK